MSLATQCKGGRGQGHVLGGVQAVQEACVSDASFFSKLPGARNTTRIKDEPTLRQQIMLSNRARFICECYVGRS